MDNLKQARLLEARLEEARRAQRLGRRQQLKHQAAAVRARRRHALETVRPRPRPTETEPSLYTCIPATACLSVCVCVCVCMCVWCLQVHQLREQQKLFLERFAEFESTLQKSDEIVKQLQVG